MPEGPLIKMKDKNGKVIICECLIEGNTWCKDPAFGVSSNGRLMCAKHNGNVGWHKVYPPEEGLIPSKSNLIGQSCERCGFGKLRLFEGDFGRFIGCDAYNENKCKYKIQA